MRGTLESSEYMVSEAQHIICCEVVNNKQCNYVSKFWPQTLKGKLSTSFHLGGPTRKNDSDFILTYLILVIRRRRIGNTSSVKELFETFCFASYLGLLALYL